MQSYTEVCNVTFFIQRKKLLPAQGQSLLICLRVLLLEQRVEVRRRRVGNVLFVRFAVGLVDEWVVVHLHSVV